MTKKVVCKNCHGRGFRFVLVNKAYQKKSCQRCGGTGYHEAQPPAEVVGVIKPVVVVRQCPGCGFKVFQKDIEELKHDMDCPGCSHYRFSQFIPA